MFGKLFSSFKSDNSTEKEQQERSIIVYAPLSGAITALDTVPDPVFAEKMLGDGLAIEPKSQTLLAPFAATVVSLFPSGHAIGLRTPSGLECLLHIGIDTVALNGQGFRPLVAQGDEVAQGTPLIELDLACLKQTGKQLVTPLVITNSSQWKITERTSEEVATAGQTPLFTAVFLATTPEEDL
ncbi:MAG: PTS glucose transporter subunit IIA [Sporomusaceae bacterium]|nr:PTS glucose transporter subunit IIA [Sporomusaceae bacterium]